MRRCRSGGGQDGGSARPAGAAGRRTGATAGLQVSCVVADNTAGVGIPTANVLPGRNTYIAYIPGRYTFFFDFDTFDTADSSPARKMAIFD